MDSISSYDARLFDSNVWCRLCYRCALDAPSIELDRDAPTTPHTLDHITRSTRARSRSDAHTRAMADRPASSVGISPSTSSSASSGASSIYSFYLINKAGGLIYQKDFSAVPRHQTNDYLRLASTFHSLHAITARGIQVAPAGGEKRASASDPTALPRQAEGIASLEARSFRLQCFQSLTGLKFLLIASTHFTAPALERVLHSMYVRVEHSSARSAFAQQRKR
jgi:hypothetical protein